MFRALMLTQVDRRTHAELVTLDESQLPPGDVTVRIEYSSLNFKDALAVTGRGAVVKNWPLVPGIDLAGVVEHSADPAWQPGDRVVVNGWGLGETEWGGLAQKARLSPQYLLRLPAAFTTREAMAIATAGYTAALCVIALQRHGLEPGTDEVLVTGAAGGVGSVAVALLAGLGFRVVASTGRPAEAEYLRFLGAAAILDRAELSSPGKPLQSERWAGVVDTVGSHTLVNACAQTQWHGAVTACGLAQGSDLPGTVMPFILRGVTLYGINCMRVDEATRRLAWELLAQHVRSDQLAQMTQEIGLSEVIAYSPGLLDGKVRGRTVVDVNR
ncbi:MDR family oxidoreductase [Methylibium petroleiphilum]|uniref:acrylyl-CoA reductase (NADPH) n=1 Tax=Methylibium petroleiphilum TaxID=105560 RepID=UPI001ACAE20E|nr:MDR family oxidoreductase [Methylibium petroleiphilum]MBN9206722.1 oxidoreductase [Methylibium petroleiphilum]